MGGAILKVGFGVFLLAWGGRRKSPVVAAIGAGVLTRGGLDVVDEWSKAHDVPARLPEPVAPGWASV